MSTEADGTGNLPYSSSKQPETREMRYDKEKKINYDPTTMEIINPITGDPTGEIYQPEKKPETDAELEGDDKLKARLNIDELYKKYDNDEVNLIRAKLFMGNNFNDKSVEEAFRFVDTHLKEHYGFDDKEISELKVFCSKMIKSHKAPVESKEINISIEQEVKGTTHKINFKTKLDLSSGLWYTTLTIDEKSFPSAPHSEPLTKIHEVRDKEFFLPKMANLLGLSQKACQVIMYDISEIASQNEEFATSMQLYKEEKTRKDENEKLAAKEAMANAPKTERIKLQGCFVPDGYMPLLDSHSHVCGETILVSEDAKGNPKVTNVCKCLAMVMGFPKSHDSDKILVELQFTKYNARTKKSEWKTIIVPIEAVTTKDGFKKHIITQGFLVQEININATIAYLEACISENAGKEGHGSAFRSIDVSEITGWTDNAFIAFKLGGRTIIDYNSTSVSEEANCNSPELVEKLIIKGTPEKYIEVIRPIANFWRMRYAMYDAMASLLLRILGISPHTGMIIYPTSQGKTTVLQLIASMFGNPDEFGNGLLYSGDGSITGINAILHMYMDLPVLFDEATNSSDKVRKGITYLAGNGAAPVRGKGGGELRDRFNHRSNVYFAAEESMMPDGINDGGNTRMLPFYERFVDAGNGKMVEDAKLGMTQNYGHIIERFLGKIFANRVGLRAYFEAAKERIAAKSTEDRVKRQAATFAAAQLAGFLLEQVLAEMGLNATMNPEKVVDAMWHECVNLNAEEPMAMKALRLFHSWFLREFNTSGLLHDKKVEYYNNSKKEYVLKTLHKGKIFLWDEETWKDFLHEEFDKELLAKGFTNLVGIYKYWRDVLEILEFDTVKKGDKIIKRTTARVSHFKSIDSEKKEQFHVIRVITDKMNAVLGLEKVVEESEATVVEPEATVVEPEPNQEMSPEEYERMCKEFGCGEYNTEEIDPFEEIDTDHEYVPGKLPR
jgi:hypothetical protein